ncbi:MAG TPA: hypothetical protein VFW07_27430 [Parafilimonas sp.]|nr:hypothetical protein [Parafilimonas sp.]
MQEQNTGTLNIIVAVYGLKTVTEQVKSLLNEGDPTTLSFIVSNRVIGEDGWHGQRKSITIIYNYNGGDLQVATAKEGDVISLSPDPGRALKSTANENSADNRGSSVLAATYGPHDVTHKVKNLISSYNTLLFPVNNILLGDAWHGTEKTLVVVLGRDNKVSLVEVFRESETCYIDLNKIAPVAPCKSEDKIPSN